MHASLSAVYNTGAFLSRHYLPKFRLDALPVLSLRYINVLLADLPPWGIGTNCRALPLTPLCRGQSAADRRFGSVPMIAGNREPRVPCSANSGDQCSEDLQLGCMGGTSPSHAIILRGAIYNLFPRHVLESHSAYACFRSRRRPTRLTRR
jgi:hypothetical protein